MTPPTHFLTRMIARIPIDTSREELPISIHVRFGA